MRDEVASGYSTATDQDSIPVGVTSNPNKLPMDSNPSKTSNSDANEKPATMSLEDNIIGDFISADAEEFADVGNMEEAAGLSANPTLTSDPDKASRASSEAADKEQPNAYVMKDEECLAIIDGRTMEYQHIQYFILLHETSDSGFVDYPSVNALKAVD